MVRGLCCTAAVVLLVLLMASARANARFTERTHVGAGSVAAGRAHSIIATPDGRVHAWGAGGRGQLGIGVPGDRLSPTVVPDLGGVVAVAAGAVHSVALTSSGEVWAWGANAFGRLGDGTRKRRTRPVRIAGLPVVKMIAAGRAHTLALTTEGEVFAWGLNASGAIGNGRRAATLTPVRVSGLSDVVTIAAGDAHSLAVTRDGRVFAWGRNDFSALGDGTTRDRPAPVPIGLQDVVAVAAGGGHSLALKRTGEVYSWGRGANGELGTGVTKVSSTPRVIPGLSARSIAAGLHFSGAITAGGHVVTWGANGSGQLGDGTTKRRVRPVAILEGTPVVSLALGDLHAVAVTASGDVRTWGEADAGRLGSGELTDQSSPIEVLSDVPDWGSEPSVEPPDSTPPTIQASIAPPLVAGWTTTPVTVSFACGDDKAIASCSAPMLVDQDGVTQVTGTAVDEAGNQSTASVTVSLDLHAPLVSFGTTPESTDAEDLVVSGTIADVASGVIDAQCNSAPVVLADGAFECAVRLFPGRNDIVISARDAVGHEMSTALTVSRTGAPTELYLSPAARTVGLNEQPRLTLLDEFGDVVENATWSSEDDTVVALSTDEPPVITTVGVGAARVVAEKDGLRAEALIRVVPDLMPGDERWALPSSPLLSAEPPLIANRVAVDVPHIFAIDAEDWDKKMVRAVTADGEVLWQQRVNGIPLLADSFGGLVAGVPDAIGDLRGLTRLGGGTTKPWRFNSAGIVDRPAQAADGTLYTFETVPNGQFVDGNQMSDKFALAIDGVSGRVISRTQLAPELDQFISSEDGQVGQTVPPTYCRSYRYDTPPTTLGPIAGADGRGYFVVRRYKNVRRDQCIEPKTHRPARTIEMGVDLVVLSRTAAPRTIPIYSLSCDVPSRGTYPCDYPVRISQLMPDGIGGMVVTWQRATHMASLTSVVVQKAMTRIDADGVPVDRDVDMSTSIEMIGQGGLALTYANSSWKAIDVRTGDIQWSGGLPNFTPLAARPDGGVAAIDWSTNELAMVDGNGAVESRHAFGLDWRSAYSGGDWIGLKGNGISAVAGTFSDATRYTLFDTKTGQQRERNPGIGVWLKTHNVIVPGLQHASIRVTPLEQDWLLRNRSRFETCDGVQRCVPLGTDEFGNRFFTIGAGAGADDTNLQCNGILTKGFNRPNDVGILPAQPMLELPIDWSLQPLIINSLVERVDAFANVLSYHCYPEERPGHFNSNSFTHGLLHAASVGHDERPPTRRQIPGWLTPVPQGAFFKQQ